MSIYILVGKLIMQISGIYSPQIGLSVNQKDLFYGALFSNIFYFYFLNWDLLHTRLNIHYEA